MLGLHHERRHQRDDGMEGRQIKKGSETCSDRAGGVCLTWFGIKVNSWDTMNVARLTEPQPFGSVPTDLFSGYCQLPHNQCWASYSKNVIYYSLLVTPFKSNIVTLLITFWQQ